MQHAEELSMEAAYAFEEEFRGLLLELRDAPQQVASAIMRVNPDGRTGWIYWAMGIALAAIIVGYFVGNSLQRWGKLNFLDLYSKSPDVRTEKIGFLLTRAIMMSLAVLTNAVVSGVIILALSNGHPATRMTAMTILLGYLLFRGINIVAYSVLAPRYSGYRMVPIEDHVAKGLYRSFMAAVLVTAVALSVCMWLDQIGVATAAHKAALILTALLAAVLLSVVALMFRQAIGRAISGEASGHENPAKWRMMLGRFWHIPALVYFAFAFLSSMHRVVLELPSQLGLVIAPIEAALVAMLAYGLLILLNDRVLLPRRDRPEAVDRLVVAMEEEAAAKGEQVDADELRAQARATAMEQEHAREPYRDLVDHGALILIVLIGFGWLFARWGVSIVQDDTFIGSFFEIFIVMFLGYMSYRAVALLIDTQMEKEGGGNGNEPGESEVGGAGESRIATLLPIFRNFLLITIVVISVMVVLSELGVNIAPLFAGAGVVGLAVGFGAQTLIRDIFSGAFFLIDDAFRKGEYIDIGEVKGTVEKISIRSMQLRHHNGPLNTVPFGEIQFVKNFSRDWAMMKLAFRVTYDTDVEKVRKLIKKFGQSLLEHPDYGPKFLQPVKSQGVTALEDSAMIVRVKFMTKPGDQFELRKVVYAGIRDIFAQEGIHFAHREVKVRLSDEDQTRELTEEQKRAIAGAVLPAVEEQQLKQAAGGDDR
ncbi:mechanosensitive ion channel family protein [Pseudovibrio sp. SPO723]|uniref:mechanosensitive ion channel family protein n=1 Tax=Nesiotobacter zosterae TaxID=392721 RepID=UPI0029C5DED7|nr:mechanosensitive ion channel family protein [Pseudovibrio sp. SPO723]MDX5594004.1 mechanosensitive ion channel family protein [Pseudovibrio sp. SPO723]